MSELLVYKASAGSGKTFTLAVEYIKLLIFNPRAYRQILAVTFTNKATAEMKERILSQLYGIQIGDKDSEAYLNRIKEETKRINVHILYKELKKQQSLSVHTWMKLFLKWKKLKKRK